jgi:dTDP-4-amino-4,6-dideoxygalactose transaminase
MIKTPYSQPVINQIDPSYLNLALSGEGEELALELEQKVQKYIGTGYAISSTNATSALHLSMCALDIKRGDKIICSVNSHPSVPAVIRHFDAEPIFIDINPDTYNMDLNQLEALLAQKQSKKLRGIIINFIAGQTIDLNEFYKLTRKNRLFVVEDATDAFGANYEGKKIGTFGADITVFTFSPYRQSNPSNCAMVTTNDDDLYERALIMRNHAIEKRPTDSLSYIYDVIDIGCDYHISAIDAAYSLTSFNTIDSQIQKRQNIAKRYLEALDDLVHVELPSVVNQHVFSHFIIKIDKNRDSFAKELAKVGVETDLHYIPLHMMSYYRTKYSLKITSFPIALRQYQHMLALPISSSMSSEQIEHVISSVKDIAVNKMW